MSNLSQYTETVEKAIALLNVDPKTCRTDDPLKWYVHRGRANVVLFLRESNTHTGDKKDALVMVAPMIPIPKEEDDQLKLYDYLLKMSHKLVTESFSTAEGWVYLSATYYMTEGRHEELSGILDSLSYYAQLFVEELLKEYVENANN